LLIYGETLTRVQTVHQLPRGSEVVPVI